MTELNAGTLRLKQKQTERKSTGLRVVAEFGFIDDYGDRWHWRAGDLIRNPDVVGLVLSRGDMPVAELDG